MKEESQKPEPDTTAELAKAGIELRYVGEARYVADEDSRPAPRLHHFRFAGTIAVQAVQGSDDEVLVAGALKVPYDQFSRPRGRQIALGRLNYAHGFVRRTTTHDTRELVRDLRALERTATMFAESQDDELFDATIQRSFTRLGSFFNFSPRVR